MYAPISLSIPPERTSMSGKILWYLSSARTRTPRCYSKRAYSHCTCYLHLSFKNSSGLDVGFLACSYTKSYLTNGFYIHGNRAPMTIISLEYWKSSSWINLEPATARSTHPLPVLTASSNSCSSFYCSVMSDVCTRSTFRAVKFVSSLQLFRHCTKCSSMS